MIELREELSCGMFRVWKLDKVYCNQKTGYQQVVIADTCCGYTLFCDGQRQSSEHTQLLYHEAMTYPGLLLLRPEHRKNALVLGSSEGVAPNILEEHFEVVYHVDLDRECQRLCQSYLPYAGRPVKNAIIDDAYSYLYNTGVKYSLICADLPELQPASPLDTTVYSRNGLWKIKSRLSEHGVFITEAGSPALWRNRSIIDLYKRMKEVFPQVIYFDVVEHEWAWLIGLNTPNLNYLLFCEEELYGLPIKPHSLDWGSFVKGFCLPKFLRDLK